MSFSKVAATILKIKGERKYVELRNERQYSLEFEEFDMVD
jgi:hypothetical protein